MSFVMRNVILLEWLFVIVSTLGTFFSTYVLVHALMRLRRISTQQELLTDGFLQDRALSEAYREVFNVVAHAIMFATSVSFVFMVHFGSSQMVLSLLIFITISMDLTISSVVSYRALLRHREKFGRISLNKRFTDKVPDSSEGA